MNFNDIFNPKKVYEFHSDYFKHPNPNINKKIKNKAQFLKLMSIWHHKFEIVTIPSKLSKQTKKISSAKRMKIKTPFLVNNLLSTINSKMNNMPYGIENYNLNRYFRFNKKKFIPFKQTKHYKGILILGLSESLIIPKLLKKYKRVPYYMLETSDYTSKRNIEFILTYLNKITLDENETLLLLFALPTVENYEYLFTEKITLIEYKSKSKKTNTINSIDKIWGKFIPRVTFYEMRFIEEIIQLVNKSKNLTDILLDKYLKKSKMRTKYKGYTLYLKEIKNSHIWSKNSFNDSQNLPSFDHTLFGLFSKKK